MECHAPYQRARSAGSVRAPHRDTIPNALWSQKRAVAHCTGSIREKGAMATGLRFVQWVHHDTREEARVEPPPEATAAVYRQIESWLPAEEEERGNILVLTTRKASAQSLQSFCQQSGRRTNVCQGGRGNGKTLYCPPWQIQLLERELKTD